MTDIHEEVVKTAKSNVLSATEKAKDSLRGVAERAAAKAGDLLLPLENEEPFDLIYESVKHITRFLSAYKNLPAAGIFLISRFLMNPATLVTVKPHQPMLMTVPRTKFHVPSRQPFSNSTMSASSKPDLSACSDPPV